MDNKKLKWLFGILGTLMLGAIGSGLWTWLLEPLSFWLGRSLFTIATLGLNSLRNAIYSDVAQGLHEGSSLALLGYTVAIPVFCLGVLSGIQMAKRQFRRLSSEVSNRITDPEARKLEIQRQSRERAEAAVRAAERALPLCLFLVLAFCFFQLFTATYVNRAVTHFQQCFAICQPYLDDTQEEEILSQFAQIRSRDDYVVVTERLYEVASVHKKQCPTFTAF